MSAEASVDIRAVSKVLILDECSKHSHLLKRFCDENGLVGLKVRRTAAISVLRRNIDLGGILFSENYGESPADTARIALTIRALRPELPIIIGRAGRSTLDDLPSELRHVFCAAYASDDMAALRSVIDRHIFILIYPNALLRGISDLTETVLKSQFAGLTIRREAPSVVHDRIIFGEVFSLIPLESNWCRGYMMLQTEEEPLLDVLGCYGPSGAPLQVRTVSDRLGEIANLIWGSFNNRYIGDARRSDASHVQVPLVVNHKHKYISFGTENPHLCFVYHLSDAASGVTFSLYERFVFNLSWAPEDFQEIDHDVDAMVESGDIEFL